MNQTPGDTFEIFSVAFKFEQTVYNTYSGIETPYQYKLRNVRYVPELLRLESEK